MTRFSVIVPVYNAEAYLDECLDSVCDQTFDDFEIICIDDGSTDASPDLLSARAMADKRVRVVRKANGGPSSARNDGVRLAQGEYICFLDADDYLELYALERINVAIEAASPDAIVFGWSYFPKSEADRFVKEHSVVNDAFYPEFSPDLLFKEMSNPYLRIAVRASALKRSDVAFDETLRVGEDAQFLFALYPCIGSVALISDRLYWYRVPQEGSIMDGYRDDVEKLCATDLKAAASIFADWKKAGLLDLYGSELMNWFVRGQLYTILRQPAETRAPLVACARRMWRSNFTARELVSLDVNEPTAHLIRIVLAASDEGKLVIGERELQQALLSWRVAEYGVVDLAVTAAGRAVSYLLANRRMLMKSSEDEPGREAGAHPSSRPESESDPELEPEPWPEPELEPELEPKPKPKPELEPKPVPELEPKPELEPTELGADREPETSSGSKPVSESNLGPELALEPEPHPSSEPALEPEPIYEPNSELTSDLEFEDDLDTTGRLNPVQASGEAEDDDEATEELEPAVSPDAPIDIDGYEPAESYSSMISFDGVDEVEPALEKPLVSVIVPVYNVEQYLHQALTSIERQTLRTIEILCVNDGSTDSSPQILAKHAQNDARIRIIDKPNGGYGSACNRGISEAIGTWIAIVEPDDWIDEAMLASMVGFAASFDEPVDIVKTPYWRIWMPDTDQQRRVNCSYRGRIKPAAQPFKLTDPGVTHLIIHHPSIWSALYRRSFLERCGIAFMEIPGAGWADNPFLAETMCQAQSIVYLDKPFYHYREETPEKTESVARSNWKISLDRWHDMVDVYERLGVTDESIRRAHIRRGFTYIGLVLEYHDIETEQDVRACISSVFDRMDDELVFSEPNISPGSKQLYAQMKGLEMPDVSAASYAAEVFKGGLYNIVNTGLGMTFDTFKSFVSSHAKREGR